MRATLPGRWSAGALDVEVRDRLRHRLLDEMEASELELFRWFRWIGGKRGNDRAAHRAADKRGNGIAYLPKAMPLGRVDPEPVRERVKPRCLSIRQHAWIGRVERAR